MLLLNLILLIDVTFSTPTPGYANHPDSSHSLAFPLWIMSGLPVRTKPLARRTLPRG